MGHDAGVASRSLQRGRRRRTAVAGGGRRRVVPPPGDGWVL